MAFITPWEGYEESLQANKPRRSVVGIEITPVCNLSCPDCAMDARLRVSPDERRDDSDLVTKIVEYSPKNAHLFFLGLGEPSMPLSQKRIAKVLNQRKDLIGLIRTNGTYPLSQDSIDLVNSERLEIELSIDQHHWKGGQTKLRVQPTYVSSIETSINEGDRVINYGNWFPNLNRILVSPLLKIDGMKILPSWEFMERMCNEFQQILGEGISVYSELPSIYEETNQEYFQQAKATLIPTEHSGWMKSKKHGFYVGVKPEDPMRYARFLVDGTYLNVEDLRHVTESWQEVDKYSKPLTGLPKVFDSKTREYLPQ